VQQELQLIEPITGPDIALWSCHFICKEPYTGPATPWHEFSAFWERACRRLREHVTVWLALDRSSRENGCMRVVPGSHRNGFLQYYEVDRASNTFAREIVQVDDSTAVDVELGPDECSLHDARIIHGAAANTSSHRRCGYKMRYMPATTLMVAEKNPGHKLWLARERPQAANRYENA
jgi:ectoine hydroxylase-related dioxygenase (phytanoyl-CoA dioxygenase family)